MTLPLTLDRLIAAGLVRRWPVSEGRPEKREFYFTEGWAQVRETLNENNALATSRISMDSDLKHQPLVDLVKQDLSIAGRLDGLIETFVIGWPTSRLIRKSGFGMDPPFQRMRLPRQGVVEMRTEHTRTFGFFVRKNTFVAHRLDLATNTHVSRGQIDLYQIYGDEVLKLLRLMASTDKDETSPLEYLVED